MESELRRLLCRWLVAHDQHRVLIRLRATSKDWLKVCHQALNENFRNFSGRVYYALIFRNRCMCCGRRRPYHEDIFAEMITPAYQRIVYCRMSLSCKICALMACRNEVLQRGGDLRVSHSIRRHIACSEVGKIQTWYFDSFRFETRKMTVRLLEPFQTYSKYLDMEDFGKFNPWCSKEKVSLKRTFFDLPEMTDLITTSFKMAGMSISWNFLLDIVVVRSELPPIEEI